MVLVHTETIKVVQGVPEMQRLLMLDLELLVQVVVTEEINRQTGIHQEAQDHKVTLLHQQITVTGLSHNL
jgi:hypothetical protein